MAGLLAALVAACGPEIQEERPQITTGPCWVGNMREFDVAPDELDGVSFDDEGCRQVCADHVGLLGEIMTCNWLWPAVNDPETSASGSGSGSDTGADTDLQPTALYCEYTEGCIGGRGHAALLRCGEVAGDCVARWLATLAHAEAASVIAFLALAGELRSHGAPPDLVRRCREAAADEIRHARAVTRLARARGVEPPVPRFDALAERDVEAIAIENAREGCVRETWAALEAALMARRAQDPAIRSVMRGIAEDEARHAELSWDLDAWTHTRLSSTAWARVEASRRAAIEQLAASLATERDAMLRRAAGLPDPATARQLLAGLHRVLWRSRVAA